MCVCVYVCGDSNQIPSLLFTAPYMILPSIHHHFSEPLSLSLGANVQILARALLSRPKKFLPLPQMKNLAVEKEKKVSVTMIFCSGWLCARYAAMK